MNEKLYLGISTGDMTPKLGARLFGYKPDGYSESLHDKPKDTENPIKQKSAKKDKTFCTFFDIIKFREVINK